jgi:hypothetical protein
MLQKKSFKIYFMWKNHNDHKKCRNPTLAKCGGEAQHFQSWGFGVLRTPECLEFDSKAQNTSHGSFLVSLERSWSVDIENGLAFVIWTSVAEVMGKRRAGNQTGSLTPDH